MFLGVDSFQRPYQVTIHHPFDNSPIICESTQHKKFSNDVYRVPIKVYKCTYSTTLHLHQGKPATKCVFSPPPPKKKNIKAKKKTRKNIHGGMRGCDESVATWAGKKKVGRWPFLSVGDSVSALCQKSSGLKFIPAPYRSERMFFWLDSIRQIFGKPFLFSFVTWFCGGYVTSIQYD